jgi:hypothetical protein
MPLRNIKMAPDHIEQLNIFKSHFLSFDVKAKLQMFNGQLPCFPVENSKLYTKDLLYINAIDLTLNGFCQNRGQGFSMGGKPKPCKLVSSMYLAHIVTQTMCYLLHTVQIKKYKVRIF